VPHVNIGVPREIKQAEGRVALTPSAARDLTAAGHRVLVESGAGAASGFPDDRYAEAGATLVGAGDAWDGADLVVKVKEPTAAEYGHFRDGLILFTYLHLAADAPLTDALMAAGVTAIAYETVTGPSGGLPLLAPMSEIAGRLAVQAGAHFLEAPHGGSGVLLGPVGGVAPGRVVVIGGGKVGYHAAAVALGLGARVTLFDTSLARLGALEEVMHGRIELEAPSRDRLEATLSEADLVVGAVLVPGARAPYVVDRPLVRMMKPGSVICDVAIDQGGCVETSRPTSHEDPVHVEEGVVHYAVTNMPGAVPATSTRALVNATLPYVKALATDGLAALDRDAGLRAGLNVHEGAITHPAVGAAHQPAPAAAGATPSGA
jgi:alanine dehydrogenase